MRTLDSQLLIFSVSFQNPLIIIETCNLQICFYLVLENLMELSTKEKREKVLLFRNYENESLFVEDTL